MHNCISCGSVLSLEENVQACVHGFLCESCKTCPLCFYEGTLHVGLSARRERWRELGYDK